MALLDLHRLVYIYNLHRRDAQFQPEHSDPLMPTPDPPHQPPTDPTTHDPLSSQDLNCDTPKTPKTTYTAVIPSATPTARGTSTRHKQEGDADRFDKYDREEYEEYIKEDLSHRVFVDFEVFLKKALHVPENWRDKWGPTIQAVKANKEFDDLHKAYCKMCDKIGEHEVAFYEPLAQMVNAILDVATSSRFEGKDPEKRQYYHVNNPGHLRGGVMNKVGLSPDLVLLDGDRRPPSSTAPLHWANALHVLEVKPHDNAISDGMTLPRLILNGERAG